MNEKNWVKSAENRILLELVGNSSQPSSNWWGSSVLNLIVQSNDLQRVIG